MSKYYKVYFRGHCIVSAEDVAEAQEKAAICDWISDRMTFDDEVEELYEEDLWE